MEDNFSIFSPGGGGGDIKPEIRQFNSDWGWIDMLSELSKTKMFDIPRLKIDSVECTKRAKAYKVLIECSKEYEKYKATKAAYKL
ncbi:MAG TPA: hypothetical protein PLU07_09275 [Ferruginibacter sp.]|nr:hypothetical protein [Ferruginibacter sp.]